MKKNIIIWIVLLIVLSSSVSATTYEAEIESDVGWAYAGVSQPIGFQIQVGSLNLSLWNVTGATSGGAMGCTLLKIEQNGVQLFSSSNIQNGDAFILNSSVILESNNYYNITCTGGANNNYKAVVTPVSVTGLTFTDGYSAGIRNDYIYGFYKLGVNNDTTTPIIPAPQVTLINPLNNTFSSSSSFNFTYNVTSGYNITNASFWTNYSGSYALNISNNSIVLNNSNNYFNLSGFSEGVYTWNIEVCDNNNNCSMASKDFKITIDQTPPDLTTNNLNINWSMYLYFALNMSDNSPNNITINDSCGNSYLNASGLPILYQNISNYSISSCGVGLQHTNITGCDKVGLCTSETYNWTVAGRLNVTAISLINNSNVLTFDIYKNGTYIGSTTNGEFYVDNLSLNTFDIEIIPSGFQSGETNITISTGYTGLIFYLFTYNSFNITIRDEIDELIIDDANITIEFISNNFNYTYTTENGTLYVDLLSPSNYTIRYQANQSYGTRKRHYLVELTNRTYNPLTLYLISSSFITGNITINTYDETSLELLENAVIYLQKRLNDNNYYTVAMYETDVAGKGYFEVEKGEQEYYKFIVDYAWKTQRLSTEKMYIQSDIINLYVPLDDDIGQDFFDLDGIIYSLSFNNNTQEFSTTWADSSLIASEFCLNIQKYVVYGKETINQSCSSSSSGSITLGGLNENLTYYAVLTSNINGESVLIASAWRERVGSKLEAGTFGLFMAVVLIIIFSFLSSINIVAMFLGVSGLLFAKLLGLINVSYPSIFGVVFVAIIIGIIIENRR